MNAADTAGCENSYVSVTRNPNCGGHGCSSIPTARNCDRQIARAEFLDVNAVRKELDLMCVQSNAKLALDHGDGRRSYVFFAPDLLEALRSFKILRSRQ